MTLLEQNLKILEKANSPLFDRFQKGDAVMSKPFTVFMSKSSHPTLEIQKNGHKVLLHSSYDPPREAERMVSKLDIKHDTKLIIVFGVGFAYHVHEILRRLSKNACLILIEKDEYILKKAAESVDLSFLSDHRVELYWGDFDSSQIMSKIFRMYFPRIPDEKEILLVPHFVSFQIYPDYYKEMWERVKDYFSRLAVMINTHIFVSTQWSVNTLKNIDEVIKNPSVKQLFGKNENKPAIVVAAGPSLNKNIDVLKEAQGKALIIAVGTSLKPLLRECIVPDIVVAIDANEKHYEHFKGLRIPEKVTLVYDGMIYPRILDEFPGMKFTCDTIEGPLKVLFADLIGERGLLPSGFSVATAAFSLAQLMRSSPIILVGQDLSFGRDGHTHALHTTFENEKADLTSGKLIPVKGNVEDTVLTTHVFLSTLRWLEEAIEKTETFCINATEGGAKIGDIPFLSLREAINTYCKESLSFDYIAEMYHDKKNFPSKKVLKKVIQSFDKGVRDVRQILDLSGEGGVKARQLLENVVNGKSEETPEFQKNALEIQAFVEEVKSRERGTFFLDPWMQEVYVFLHRSQNGLKELQEYSKTIQELNRAGVFFEGLHKASCEVLPLLAEAKRKTERVYRDWFEPIVGKKLCIATLTGLEHSMMLKYIHEDCMEGFSELGHKVVFSELPKDLILTKSFRDDLLEHKPDILFTIDNHGLHPSFVEALAIPVISFYIDDPHTRVSKGWIKSNYLMFVTEFDDTLELRDSGFPHVHQITIGANPRRFYQKSANEVGDKYKSDVSFVALSLEDSFRYFERLPNKIKPSLAKVVEKQSEDLLVLMEDVIHSLNLEETFKYEERHTLERGFRFVTRKATALHRIKFLRNIPKDVNFKLFGDEGWKFIFPEASYCGKIDYGTELINVYNATKINIGLNNYGLAGLHARVLDIALCRAFGLFEFTPEIEQYFTNGEDIVWFKTPEEMAELIEHYLANPEERKRIAENAYKNVMENHTTVHRMKKMLDIVMQEM